MSDELKPFNAALYGAIRQVIESVRVGPVGQVRPVTGEEPL